MLKINICVLLLYFTSNVLASCSKNLSSKVLSPGLLPAPSNKALYSYLNNDKYIDKCLNKNIYQEYNKYCVIEISDNKIRVIKHKAKKIYKMLMLRNSVIIAI